MITIRAALAIALLSAGPVYAQTVIGPQGPPGEAGRPAPNSFAGPAVDAQGNQAVDPTENVKSLVEAEKQRNNDLRESEQRHAAEVAELLSRLVASELRRTDQLQAAAAALNASERARIAEVGASRLQALERQADLDREAVAEANRAAIENAAALAIRVQQSAEVLSGQVNTAAGAATDNLTRLEARIVASLNEIGARLVSLEQFQNQTFGQARVADPQLEDLKALVATLAQAQATGTGRDTGASNTIIFIAMGISALLALLGIVAAIAAITRRPPEKIVVSPQ